MRSDHKATQSLAIYPIREGGEGGLSRRLPKAKNTQNRFRGAIILCELTSKPLG